MFIDATRYGGLRLLRLNVAAVAYIDAAEGGSAVHLVGGETLRLNEDPATIEQRIAAAEQAGEATGSPAAGARARGNRRQ